MQKGKGSQINRIGSSSQFISVAPTPLQLQARPRSLTTAKKKNVTDIEICHRGPGRFLEVDEEERDLLRTNKKAETLYHMATMDAAFSGVQRPNPKSTGSIIAPIDDDLGFGIFEDDDTTPTKTRSDSDDLLELESANLW